jgi:hypothetical protein
MLVSCVTLAISDAETYEEILSERLISAGHGKVDTRNGEFLGPVVERVGGIGRVLAASTAEGAVGYSSRCIAPGPRISSASSVPTPRCPGLVGFEIGFGIGVDAQTHSLRLQRRQFGAKSLGLACRFRQFYVFPYRCAAEFSQ